MDIRDKVLLRKLLDDQQGEQTVSVLISQAPMLLAHNPLFKVSYWLGMGPTAHTGLSGLSVLMIHPNIVSRSLLEHGAPDIATEQLLPGQCPWKPKIPETVSTRPPLYIEVDSECPAQLQGSIWSGHWARGPVVQPGYCFRSSAETGQPPAEATQVALMKVYKALTVAPNILEDWRLASFIAEGEVAGGHT